jgi:hypothetical protein
MTLTSMDGKTTRKSSHALTTGENRIDLGLQDVIPGLYMLNLTLDGNNLEMKKMIRQ